jgi:hypothetical protein
MGAHENPVQATRSSKRRASAAHSQQLPTAKKRVVLGDLTNSLNLGSFRDSDFGPNKPKCTLKWKEEEEEEEEERRRTTTTTRRRKKRRRIRSRSPRRQRLR